MVQRFRFDGHEVSVKPTMTGYMAAVDGGSEVSISQKEYLDIVMYGMLVS